MEIKLLDYVNRTVDIEIGDINTVQSIQVTVISGDEIIDVFYKNGDTKKFDSGFNRVADYYDGSYTIYDRSNGINLLDDTEWLNRKDSYDFCF